MRKYLNSLTYLQLTKIAKDFGCLADNREDQITFLIEQAKGYRLNVADFKSRYEINC